MGLHQWNSVYQGCNSSEVRAKALRHPVLGGFVCLATFLMNLSAPRILEQDLRAEVLGAATLECILIWPTGIHSFWSTHRPPNTVCGWWCQVTIVSPDSAPDLQAHIYSYDQGIQKSIHQHFLIPSLLCLLLILSLPKHPPPLLSSQLLLFHKNVAKMLPHWEPSLVPKMGLVALLCVHIVPCTFSTRHCIIITCSFFSLPTRLCVFPEQELCLG